MPHRERPNNGLPILVARAVPQKNELLFSRKILSVDGALDQHSNGIRGDNNVRRCEAKRGKSPCGTSTDDDIWLSM
jgi:hypothetical protein